MRHPIRNLNRAEPYLNRLNWIGTSLTRLFPWARVGLATSSFVGDAFNWHLTLERPVQQDWLQLQRAMLGAQPANTNKIPTPALAAAPLPRYHNNQLGLEGREWNIGSAISLVRCDTNISQFLEDLSRKQDGSPTTFTSFSLFSLADGRHRDLRWRNDSLTTWETEHYQLKTVQTPSEFSGSGDVLKINENDSFAKSWTGITKSSPPKPELEHRSTISFGNIQVELNRAFRVPDDGYIYPLPEKFGTFPLYNVDNHDLPGDVKAKGYVSSAHFLGCRKI
ncbi:hypothetical protein FRB95_013972 [Tulasnella sp. JGI-2019a]|nr:hypothetical protein FRB95_013972 [Tulasnella sp. JGI-2019a]